MKKSELQKIIREEIKLALSEKLNFSLGTGGEANPNKPMKDDFEIVFKDLVKAGQTIGEINKELVTRGLKPIEMDYMSADTPIVFKKPTQSQMQIVLDKVNKNDIQSIGRVL